MATKRQKRFESKLEDYDLLSDCATCKWKSLSFNTCLAFPTGIPEQLLSGELRHRTPFGNDHGYLYEPVKEEK